MNAIRFALAAVVASIPFTRAAAAATLKVGAGETYATPCGAVAAANANDLIEVAPGTYTDSCTISKAGITIRGVGGRPKIDLSGTDHPAGYKGIYVVAATGVTIENLELTGAHVSDANGANGAGIRAEADGLTVRGCFIHDNQNGILGDGSIIVEYSEFFQNGLGPGCTQDGCTHNLYIGQASSVTFRFNWTHRIASDLPDKGHLFKSRALANYVLYNRITGEDGPDSYEIDMPNGGLAVVVGNVIQKGANAGNSTLFAWGEEGASNPDKRVFVVNNTFVNDRGSGTFLGLSGGATLTAHNNIFFGNGTPASTGALSADNMSGVDPLFVNAAAQDYRLKMGSPAIGKGVAPGSADQFSLVPASEYVHPLQSVARLDDGMLDLGAFEFGTDLSGATTDGGSPITGDGGTSKDGGGPGQGDAASGGSTTSPGGDGSANGAAPGSASNDDSGCGCRVVGDAPRASGPFAGLVALALLFAARLIARTSRSGSSRR